jgi:disulfide bond formation protein DsbB
MSRAEAGLRSTRSLLAVATVVAAVATVGSLTFSLGLGLTPCRLCWYQRILMYPLVVVLGVAALERRPGVARTALPLSVFGGVLAAYHSWLQVTQTTCSVGVISCATVQYRLFGILTIPNLSLLAFLLVTGIVGYGWVTRPDRLETA